MGTAEDDELRRLSARAYGPDADIHHDPEAMARLHHLLDGRRERTRDTVDPAAPVAVADAPATVPDRALDPAPGSGPVAPEPAQGTPWIRDFVGSARGRYTLLWAATLVAVLAVAGAAVTVAERVQSAPLAPEAVQVARLSPDPMPAELAGIFGPTGADGATARAFDVFEGLRVVVTPDGSVFGDSDYGGRCLLVMSVRTFEAATENSLPGQMWMDCSAGAFPAAVDLLVPDAPEFAESSSVGRALQFVYDDDHDEVVVFAEP